MSIIGAQYDAKLLDPPENIVLMSGNPNAKVLCDAHKAAATAFFPTFVLDVVFVVVASIDEEFDGTNLSPKKRKIRKNASNVPICSNGNSINKVIA